MQRIAITPRSDWQKRVEEVGFLWHTADGVPYWNESALYSFRMDETSILEGATNELQGRVIDAVETIIGRDWFSRMGIGERAARLIVESWNHEPPEQSLYGRFDLVWSGVGDPKMLEYNADTPTSLMEAAVVQWFWLQDTHPEFDQFNSIHERLIKRWGELKGSGVERLHLASMESAEDLGTLRYLGDCARQAGIEVVQFLRMTEIGWNGANFVDLGNQRITHCCKLYPWEWLLRDPFGAHVEQARWLEPAWKMLLSNKAVLAILWELFPGHPNLLPASFQPLAGDYVTKPYWSREGQNVTVRVDDRKVAATKGTYADEPIVYQRFYERPGFDGLYPVIGSWVVGEEAAGIGIREDAGLVTGNLSRFVPHYIHG